MQLGGEIWKGADSFVEKEVTFLRYGTKGEEVRQVEGGCTRVPLRWPHPPLCVL